jgi:predicted Zn-dependent protease
MVYLHSPHWTGGTAEDSARTRGFVWQRRARLHFIAALDTDVAEERERLLQEARRLLERSLDDWPGSQMARCYLAQVQAARGDVEGALGTLEQLLARKPDVQVAYTLAAGFALQAGEPRRAIEILGDAASRWPFDPTLWAALAQASGRAGFAADVVRYRARMLDLLADQRGG